MVPFAVTPSLASTGVASGKFRGRNQPRVPRPKSLDPDRDSNRGLMLRIHFESALADRRPSARGCGLDCRRCATAEPAWEWRGAALDRQFGRGNAWGWA